MRTALPTSILISIISGRERLEFLEDGLGVVVGVGAGIVIEVYTSVGKLAVGVGWGGFLCGRGATMSGVCCRNWN